MNSLNPVETLDIVASVIAACGAPVFACGSWDDWDCCGALGWSWARSDTTGARRSPTNIEIANRVVIRKQPAGRMVAGQPRTLSGLPYKSIRRSRSAFAITETELKLIAAPAIIGLRRTPNSG